MFQDKIQSLKDNNQHNISKKIYVSNTLWKKWKHTFHTTFVHVPVAKWCNNWTTKKTWNDCGEFLNWNRLGFAELAWNMEHYKKVKRRSNDTKKKKNHIFLWHNQICFLFFFNLSQTKCTCLYKPLTRHHQYPDPFSCTFSTVNQIPIYNLAFHSNSWSQWLYSVVDRDNSEVSPDALFFHGLPVPTCFAVQQQSPPNSHAPALK